MCVSFFVDVEQAFDKGWHEGLLYKLKLKFPDQLYFVLKSYLEEGYFQVRIDDTLFDYHLIKAVVPQESVIRPLLNLIYADAAPTRGDTLIATFADNTAILYSDVDLVRASNDYNVISVFCRTG
jgi:adenylate/nucleoside-diphosphate kinase